MSVRRRVVAVLGPAKASVEEIRVAEAVGACAARRGWVVLTGGGPGVMAGASHGAADEGGSTVGVLPVEAANADYPNPWVEIAIFTGAGSARNNFNVLSADLCIAIGGGPGTLSEIALAMKAGTPVWCWRSWNLDPPAGTAIVRPRVFQTAEQLLAALTELLSEERSP